jgi:hypothetical protein
MVINTAVRNAMADAFGDLFNNGALEIRTGASPGPGSAATGTLLASITLPADAIAAASSGAAAKSGTWSDASADATGTAGYARLKSSDGLKVVDLSVGTSGADLNLDTLSLVAAGTFTVTTMTFTMPAS